MTAKDKIKAELDRTRKGLSPKDNKRWSWGYSDGLEYALKCLEEEQNAGNRNH